MAKLTIALSVAVSGLGAYYEQADSFDAEITYTVRRGCQATYTQPGEDDTASIEGVTILLDSARHNADWLVGIIEDDDEIIALCLQDWAENEIDAEDRRAEARRDDRLLGDLT